MPLTPLTAYPNFGTRKATPPIAFPTTLADGATWQSDLMASGFGGCLFAGESDQVVTLEIQRYADLAGLIPVGGLLTQALVADTPGYVGASDGLPFIAWNALIVNASGSTANLSNLSLLTGVAP